MIKVIAKETLYTNWWTNKSVKRFIKGNIYFLQDSTSNFYAIEPEKGTGAVGIFTRNEFNEYFDIYQS